MVYCLLVYEGIKYEMIFVNFVERFLKIVVILLFIDVCILEKSFISVNYVIMYVYNLVS